ncbi:MAG TPA: hypothetical protein VE549_17425 [Myxococcaceae bacterium]|nr:hypothetical protein [Myxococcaceae bacterium]
MSRLIPRLDFETVDPALQEMFRPRVERLGYLGEFFRVMSHAPGPMAHFHGLTDSLKKILPDNFTQIVSLALSSRLGNRYEQYQNERLSRKLGFSDDWIAEAITPRPGTDSGFTPAEKAVQNFAISVMEKKGHGVERELEAVIDALGPERAVAVMWLIGRTVTHALISNALQLEPPVSSIFDGKR